MKKKLLLLWENAYMFGETIAPRIPDFANQFDVYVALVGCSMFPLLYEKLILLRTNGCVKEFWIIPDAGRQVKHHMYIGSMIKKWREFKFDICMSSTDLEAVDKYFYTCVLRSDCLRVVFQSSLGFILQNENKTRTLREQQEDIHNKISVILKKIKKRIPTLLSPAASLEYFPRLLRGLLIGVVGSKVLGFTDKVVLPLLIAGKVFPQNKYDKMRVPGSGRADAYVFCDEIEAELFSKVTGKDNVYIAQYPTQDNCRCSGNKENKTIVLVPLTGFDDDRVPQKSMEMMCRDIQIVSKESGAKTFHLRPHPGYKNLKWPLLLRNILRDKGIDVECVDNDHSIRAIMCDYLGMAGLASNALKDARSACNSAFVVGFVGPSKSFFSDPKYIYGKSEGICWIEEDGSYDPEIFKTSNFFPGRKKSIIEIIKSLSDAENKHEVHVGVG